MKFALELNEIYLPDFLALRHLGWTAVEVSIESLRLSLTEMSPTSGANSSALSRYPRKLGMDMLSRISDAIGLLALRLGEWIEDLSPNGRRMFIICAVALLALAAYYGLIPSRFRRRNDPRSLINW